MADPDDLDTFAAQLKALKPQPETLDRTAIFFQAAQTVLRRRLRFWQLTTAGFAVLTILFGILLLQGPRIVERVVTIPPPPPWTEHADEDRYEPPGNYLQRRRMAVEQGVDSLPGAASTGEASAPHLLLSVPRGMSRGEPL